MPPQRFALTKYIHDLLPGLTSPFDPHTTPFLELGRLNRILVYAGSFNPPHKGHHDLLNHVFYHCGRDLNLIAAVILPLDEQALTNKFGSDEGVLRLTKAHRIQLWQEDGKLRDHGPFWVWKDTTRDMRTFRHNLVKAVAADGLQLQYIALYGGDQVKANLTHPLWRWGYKDIITSNMGRPHDFMTSSVDTLAQLDGFDPWEEVQPDVQNLRKVAAEAVSKEASSSAKYATEAFRIPRRLFAVLNCFPFSASKESRIQALVDKYLEDYKHIRVCRVQGYAIASVRFVGIAGSRVPDISSTQIREAIERYRTGASSKNQLREALKDLVLSPDNLIQLLPQYGETLPEP